MTDILANVFFFLLGLFLSIQFAGALYSVIDHWYKLKRYRLRVATGIFVWGGLFFGVPSWLPTPSHDAFIAGVFLFAGGHLLVILLSPFPLLAAKRAEKKAYKALMDEIK